MFRHRWRAGTMAATLLMLTLLLGACVDHDPRDDPDTDLFPTAPASAGATPAATSAEIATPSSAVIGSAHVALTTATSNAVTIDVTDGSGSLIAASSGAPGDGASVESGRLLVTNASPTTLRLTWVGGPCDSANTLSIDASRQQLLLVQPECPGDAIATDRVLDLEFATPVRAADLEAFIQDGLDT